MIPLILIVMIVSFGIFSLVPNPFAALIENPRIKKSDIQRLIKAWGFDLPWYLRFFKWFGGVIRGDWGPSLLYPGSLARDIIARALPVTVRLMGIELLVSLAVALPIGIISAVKQYSVTDYVVTVFSFLGMSMPSFWLGLMMMMLFSVVLKRPDGMTPLLPAGGIIHARTGRCFVLGQVRGPGTISRASRLRSLFHLDRRLGTLHAFINA